MRFGKIASGIVGVAAAMIMLTGSPASAAVATGVSGAGTVGTAPAGAVPGSVKVAGTAATYEYSVTQIPGYTYCSANEVRIPFAVGEDRSRTWVLTRTADGVRLKHDHRHEDGTPDRRTNYGGDSAPGGTAERQSFPADAESKALFVADGIPQSVTNVWTVEIQPGQAFVYQLRRPDRHFRVGFDLSRPVRP